MVAVDGVCPNCLPRYNKFHYTYIKMAAPAMALSKFKSRQINPEAHDTHFALPCQEFLPVFNILRPSNLPPPFPRLPEVIFMLFTQDNSRFLHEMSNI